MRAQVIATKNDKKTAKLVYFNEKKLAFLETNYYFDLVTPTGFEPVNVALRGR